MHALSRPAFSPLALQQRPLAWQVAAVLLGTLFLALSSHIAVPLWPVPMTMQTYAVALVGALYGWRLGSVVVLAWLAQAAAGLPVLAGGGGGLQVFVGPTAGYLFAFPLAAALAGWLAERGWNGHRPGLAFAAALASNALCLLLGAAWLALSVGAAKALALGVAPFVLGGVLKSALGAATLWLLVRPRRRQQG
jgi:biotin transport system substrate-specific component